ncbi:hypothetical protein CENSYa_1281 [Cenarchaeum symbiosum A]|uniref:Uncharacterized protein n=1 Tax=Cenarchaeum symbiosum (strain A) TaxID=414004 RepID=A0RX37_CENSY|nr:hypothetical protein CENSYa_1281 [Cenarchaeum symbiosum A]
MNFGGPAAAGARPLPCEAQLRARNLPGKFFPAPESELPPPDRECLGSGAVKKQSWQNSCLNYGLRRRGQALIPAPGFKIINSERMCLIHGWTPLEQQNRGLCPWTCLKTSSSYTA